MPTAIVNIGQLVTLAGPARPRVGKELNELAILNDAAMLIDDPPSEASLKGTGFSPYISADKKKGLQPLNQAPQGCPEGYGLQPVHSARRRRRGFSL